MLKKYSFLFAILAFFAASTAFGAGNESDHLGLISSETLFSEYDEFSDNYDRYEPSSSDVALMQNLKGKTLTVLFGTWCHDSVREVPRLLKLLDLSAVALSGLNLIAVDQSKRDPDGYSERFNLMYTPTFILLDGNREIARIVERPEISFAKDLTNKLKPSN